MKRDAVLLAQVVLVLVFLGILMVYSVATVRGYDAENMEGHTLRALWGQLIRVGIGLIGLCLAACLDYQVYSKRSVLYPMVALTLLLLVLVLLVGEERHGARRWLIVAGLSMQPSDLAKLVIVILLATKLAESQERIQRFWKGVAPPMMTAVGFGVLIALEKDIGAPIVMGTVALLMLMMAGAKWWHLALNVLLGIPLVGLYIWLHPHAQVRIYSWWNPLEYRLNESYQLMQSLWAFAGGGLTGRGPGAGQQKLHYLPEAHSDFIFAALGEELGLIGTVFAVVLFGLFVILALRIAVCAPDLLGALLAAGIASTITLQAVLSMAVTTGLVPTKGFALPFISAGGTSLIFNLTMVGILLNVAAQGALPSSLPARKSEISNLRFEI